MANFYWQKYVGNWEIDYYNYLTPIEKEKLSRKLDLDIHLVQKCFYKDGDDWCYRCSGMTYILKNLEWYPKIKKHLDEKFQKFIRKEKLNKINEK